MERLTRFFVLIALFVATAVSPGCKQKAAEKKGSSKSDNAVVTPPNPTPTTPTDDDTDDDDEPDDPCENTSTSDDDDETDDEDDEDEDFELRGKSAAKGKSTKSKTAKSKSAKRGFNLVDSVTYEDIESIIDKKCLSCHDSGGTSPILDTYAKVKSKASSIQSEIDDGTMPPSGSTKLTSSEKTKIADWITDGKLETAEDSSDDEDTTTDEDDEDTSSGCDDDDADDEVDEDDDTGFDKDEAFQELLNPKKLKECHEDGKVYDRGKEKCHISSIAKSFDCSVEGIVKKFKASGITLKTSGDKLDGFEDYEVDQCGEYKSDPVVFFYKKVDSAADEIGLSIKVLCKKNSPACAR